MIGIYKITNQINGNAYVGQSVNIEMRWNEHISKSSNKNSEEYEYPLYRAFRKYGIDNFSFMVIEKINAKEMKVEELQKILNEREKYWIEFYGTYKNGYNQTMGGDGNLKLDHQKILSLYEELQNAVEVSKKIGCHVDTVRKILKNSNVNLRSSKEISMEKCSREVFQYSKDGILLNTFPSQRDAARYLMKNGYAKDNPNNIGGVGSQIGAVIKGKRKTAYGFIWKTNSSEII